MSKIEDNPHPQHDEKLPVVLTLPDIRNKLSPIKNLIAMLEDHLCKGAIKMHPLILKEIEQCKESLKYLSGN
jgi:hypothetical protein